MAVAKFGARDLVYRGKPKKSIPSIKNADPDVQALMMLLGGADPYTPPVFPGAGHVGLAGLFPAASMNAMMGAGAGVDAGAMGQQGPDIASIVSSAVQGGNTGKRISDAVRRAKKPEQQQSPDQLAALLDELMRAATAGQQSFDYEQALKDSAADITRAFGRGVGHIRSQMGKARHDTQVGTKEIDEMYRALSADYAKGAANATAEGKRGAKAMQFLANEAQNQITKSANQQITEQAALAKSLGVQDAMPDVAQEQREGVQEAVNRIQQRGQRDASDQVQYGQSQSRFLDRGGKNALLEGTNRRGDLVADLQDFLQDSRGSIADLLSQRDQAIAANRAKILDSVSSAQQDQSKTLFDQLMAIANLKFKIEDGRADNSLAAQKLAQSRQGGGSGDSPFPGFMQDYANIIGMTSQPEEVKGALDQLLTSDQFREGRFQNPTTDEMLKLTPFEAADMAERALRQAGINNPNDIALARLAAMQAVAGSR